ncbi:cell division protein ZapA [Lactiplantibacillus mudanjiangensis]|uniref:Cell division protein ZapA [Lactobacillus sp.] n=1 Tax=Lactiplantibacillus mudanjiangensis TaxID=1296538 RepID=A0A660EBR0_9LACO|nr:cell division protein ZapA [Lactiplantibacillus mudanjiangensis]VDG19221.1 cell division protein ZapA [Lactobacillus sp.] [Lactiplantibacillus mudanjiangensis]VDG25616.1 cell division protein ZapA [Lactobacillus sp.] [Lactiplantibacillus mudanjiangensis]VDG29986.1 cell division protein ZapA [Lactobacillus sp.] [Lactiplantibacillus mudanjiangensis]VDG33293.1 cell division protein ZapA [Lactobacillus sp.] [Lactiplantibacillus mudanjiangensis]
MAASKRRFKAEIDGHDYTIIGSASDRHMQTVTNMMNEQIATLKKLSPDLTSEQIAILLAFNAISDQVDKQAELLKMQANDAEA